MTDCNLKENNLDDQTTRRSISKKSDSSNKHTRLKKKMTVLQKIINNLEDHQQFRRLSTIETAYNTSRFYCENSQIQLKHY
ncbi:hypothetical protein M5K25_011179 [Dendrobium thyrsiflorum]|uniref:Uncharacterized protein n=1 Tax=Dendrobium thyrsiflorum TaxID=117978 RepID=A0ABD0V225_DENTH